MRMTRISLMLLVVLSAGCASRPHTTREKWLLGLMVAGQAADYFTTTEYIRMGGTEANPFLGRRPDDETVLLFKLATTGFFYGLGQLVPEHREMIYTWGAITNWGVAGWNYYQIEKHR